MILLEKSTKVTITTKHKDRYENISHHYISAFCPLTLGFGSVCMAHAEVNSSSTQQVNGLSSGAQTEENKDENLLDQIPRWIDATPTIFPEQSNEPIVPPTVQTEDQTWFDRKQKKSVIGPIVHLEKLIIGLVKLTHKTCISHHSGHDR